MQARDIAINDFKIQLCYYIHFRTNTPEKGLNSLILLLWVKMYHYSSSRTMALELNNLPRFIHYSINKPKNTYPPYIKQLVRRCPWCNGYRRRKCTRRHEFKSWTKLIAFHIALIPLGKVWIQVFSLQIWVNSRTDCFFSVGEVTSQGEGKTLNSNLLDSA